MTTTGDEAEVARNADDLVHAVVRLMPDPAVVVDGSGKIVAANSLAEQQFGYPPDGLVGVPVDALVPDRFRGRHAEHRSEYDEQPMQRPMGAGLALSAVRRDGSEFPVDISLAPLGVPERPLTLAAVRDLTERRAQWQAEDRLAAIVSSSEDAMLSVDLSGALTSWNPGAEHLLGFEASEIVGRSFWRFVPPTLRAEMEERMARVRSGMRVPTYDTTRLHRDGHPVDVAETMSILRERSGEPGGFSAVLHDITERKRAEGELRELLAESQRRERWLEAMSEIRLALFAGTDQSQWLDLTTRRVSELLDADGVMVLLPAGRDPDALQVVAARGDGAIPEMHDLVLIDQSLAGQTFRTGRSIVTTDFHEDSPAAVDQRVLVGPAVLAALTSSAGPTGVLVVTRSPGRGGFEHEDVRLVESFAQQAGLGMELAQGQAERAQFTLVADRERIARDLHDHVIQRLFAVGMSLQAAAHSVSDHLALERIEDSVEALDATIRDVRSTIFALELQATSQMETSARSRILDAATMAAPALGFQPRLSFDGPIDTKVPDELVPDILAVVREALSNTARHAAATSVQVRVQVGVDLLIEVTDDGRGAGERTRSSGLANLQTRAERRGGSMRVGSGRAERGTSVTWRVPLPS